jgi:hypothetical protein
VSAKTWRALKMLRRSVNSADKSSQLHEKRLSMDETEFIKDIDEQKYSYLELCAMHEKTPSVLGFAEYLKEAYEEQ